MSSVARDLRWRDRPVGANMKHDGAAREVHTASLVELSVSASLPDGLVAALAARYRIERELGAGGMATVYLAHDLRHRRLVALKVLPRELSAALGAERFLREIEICAGLVHPHILPLYDSGDADGTLFYVMPYVDGESVRDRLDREKQLPIEAAVSIAREVADALGYAHGRGVVHRDIKPANILLESGHAVVMDFGIARAIDPGGRDALTATGLAIGTPAYMSPEQASRSHDVDGRSDIYALGCVLYEMLTGQAPFTGPTAQSVLLQHLAAAPPTVTAMRPTVSLELATTVSRCLAKAPADRFSTAAELSAALATRPTAATSPRRPKHRWRWAASLLLVAAAASLTVWRVRARGSAPLDENLIAVMPFRAASSSPALRELAQQIPDAFWTKVTGEFGPRTTDPATIQQLWMQSGGTERAGLPEATELRIARDQGATRLVRGIIENTGDHIRITASLLSVPTGQVRVPPTTVEGAADHWVPMLDSIVVLLLTHDFGLAAIKLPELSRYAPTAVQALLAGRLLQRDSRFPEAARMYDRALALDTNLVLAAAYKYDAGESDTAAARYAWQRQERLDPRERAYFRAEAGWRFGTPRTGFGILAAWDSIVRAGGEYAPLGDLVELGDQLRGNGSLSSWPNWRARLREVYEAVDRRAGAESWPFMRRNALTDQLSDSTFDSVRAQRLFARLAADREAHNLADFRWEIAIRRGDSAEARRVFPLADDTTSRGRRDIWARMLYFATQRGEGVADGDRAASITGDSVAAMLWARSRGRHVEWLRRRNNSMWGDVRVATLQLRDALFLGEADDSTASAAARVVAKAMSEGSAKPEARSLTDYVAARCWSTLWRVQHGDTLGARATVRYLSTDVPVPYKCPSCASLIEVLLARGAHANIRSALERWDDVAQTGPLPIWGRREDGTMGLDNLLLARWLAEAGDTVRALAASRRVVPFTPLAQEPDAATLYVDYLREEGRLAAVTGDVVSARRAYTHYLALREAPDSPAWRAVRDSVQRELGALGSGRPTSR